MATNPIWQSKEFKDKALLALLMLQIRASQNLSDQAASKPENSLEILLYQAGFNNKEISEITGTAASTVSDRLKLVK